MKTLSITLFSTAVCVLFSMLLLSRQSVAADKATLAAMGLQNASVLVK
jgi:hypothetical protein